MNEAQNQAIVCITHAIVLNNAFGAAQALRNAEYDKREFIPDCEIELRLLQLFLCERQKYFELMASIEWKAGEARTNKPEIKEQLMALTNIPDTAESKGDWYKHILILLNT